MKSRLKSAIVLAFVVACGAVAFAAPRVTEETTSSTIVKDIAMSQFDEAFDTGIAVDDDKWELIELDANKNVATADASGMTYAIKPGTQDGDAQIVLKWLGAELADTNRVFNINVATIRSMEKKVKNFDDAGKTATVEIVTHYAQKRLPTAKVLFLGTACTSHTKNMKEALTNAVNGVASKAYVDYHIYYDYPDGTWYSVKGSVNQGGRMSKTQVDALTTTGDDRVLANGHHAAMEEFYKLLSDYIADLREEKVDPYDYIVFEFDGSLLGTASKKNQGGSTYGSDHSTYVYNETRETMVATVLQRYYDLGRICWVVNDWKNDEDQQADPNVDYFVPAKYSKGLLGDNNWKGLQGLLNPDYYLDGIEGVRQVKVDTGKEDAGENCWVGHGITRGIANEYEGSEEPAHWTTYTNATEIGEVLAKMLHVVDVGAVVTDFINTNLQVTAHRFYQSKNGEDWTEESLLGGSTLEKSFDPVQNCVTGVIHGLSADWWTKLEIDVKDESGKFLVWDDSNYWVTKEGDTYSYDPNDTAAHDGNCGPSLAWEFDAETGAKLTETNAWTSVPWTVKVGSMTLEPTGVERDYNGLSTNATVVVKDKETAIDDAVLTVCYGPSDTGPWAEPVEYDKDAFKNVTNLYAKFIAEKVGYLTATGTPVQVWIKPLTIYVEGVDTNKVYSSADPNPLPYKYDLDNVVAGEETEIRELLDQNPGSFGRVAGEDVNTDGYAITNETPFYAGVNYKVEYRKATLKITKKDILEAVAIDYVGDYDGTSYTIGLNVGDKDLQNRPMQVQFSRTGKSGQWSDKYAFGAHGEALTNDYGAVCVTNAMPVYVKVQGPKDHEGNYNTTNVQATVTIKRLPVTVKAADCSKKPGEKDPDFAWDLVQTTKIVSGERPGVYSALSNVVDLVREKGETSGSYDITTNEPFASAYPGVLWNYRLAFIPGKLTIQEQEKLKIYIDDRTVTYGDKTPTNLAFKTGSARYDRTGVDETKIDGLDTVKFATTYRMGSPVGGNYPIYTNSADLSSSYYALTVVPGKVTVLPAPITPVKPGEEPPTDPTVPYTYAPDIVRYYDGAGTNINPVTVNLLPGNVPEYRYRLDGKSEYVAWKDLQITNVHYNADGSIKSNKVWYTVTTKPTNYYSATNYAWVTILPNVITVAAVDTNKVYGLDWSRTPPTKPDPDFSWIVDWEKSEVAPGEETSVLAALEACEEAAPEGKILMRIPEPVTPAGVKPETDMEDVLDDRAPHYKRFDVITTNAPFTVVIDGRRNYRVEFVPGDFAIYPDNVVFASDSGTFDYVGIYDGAPHTIDLVIIPGADHKGNPTEVSFASLAEGPWTEWIAYGEDWRKALPTYTHVTNRAPVYVKARNVPNFYETNMVAYVTITQRTVRVTAESASRDYDGTELRNGDFTVAPATADTGFVGDEGFSAVTMTDESAITAVGAVDNVIATTEFRDGTSPADYRVVREKGLLEITPAQIVDDPTESVKPWAWTSDVIVWTNDVPEVTVDGTNIVVRIGLWTAEDDAKAVLRYSTVDPAVAQASDWKDSLTFTEICTTQVWCNVSCENYSPTNVSAYVVILSREVDIVDDGAEEVDKPLPNPKTEEAANEVLDGIVDNTEILETGDPNPNYDPTKPGWEAGQLDGHVYLAFTSIANLPDETERKAAEQHLKETATAYKAANPNVRNFEARSVDVKLAYSQTFGDSSRNKIQLIGDENEELIPFTLSVDLSMDRQVLQVTRYHNGEVLPLTAPEGYSVYRNEEDPSSSAITIMAKRYSEFIILTGEPYTPTPPGGCEPEPEPETEGLVYQFRAQLYTTKGVVRAARSSGSICAPDESSACLVMRGKDKTVIDGWLYSCTRTCSGLQDASVVMWDSYRKATVSDAAFDTQVLNIMGVRNTDAEWAWNLTGTVVYDGVREQTISLQGAGYGTFNVSERLYTTFSGNVAGTASASYDLSTKSAKAALECVCEPSEVLTCETYDTLAFESKDTVMFGRWKMKYNASASKAYGERGYLKLPSYVK